MTCGQTPYQYSNLSRGKYDVARYQLDQFEQHLYRIPSVLEWRREGEHHVVAPIWAHSDGAILQLYGSFDAIACSIAHHFSLTNSKRASFGRRLVKRLPSKAAPVGRSIQAVVESAEWKEIDELRNEAAHRGVVVRYFTASSDGTEIYVDPRSASERREAFSLVQRLVTWAEWPLRWFWLGAEEWRAWEPTILGSTMDMDAGPDASI